MKSSSTLANEFHLLSLTDPLKVDIVFIEGALSSNIRCTAKMAKLAP